MIATHIMRKFCQSRLKSYPKRYAGFQIKLCCLESFWFLPNVGNLTTSWSIEYDSVNWNYKTSFVSDMVFDNFILIVIMWCMLVFNPCICIFVSMCRLDWVFDRIYVEISLANDECEIY